MDNLIFKENFNLFSGFFDGIKSFLENIPIIGIVFKVIFECLSLQNLIISLIPLITLFIRNGEEDLLANLIVIFTFYLLSIISAIILQYWVCSNSDDNKNKNFIDKSLLAITGTWFIPMMFTIFMVINWIIRLPMFAAFKELTFTITFFIQHNLMFGLVMYFIIWSNLCAFRESNCK